MSESGTQGLSVDRVALREMLDRQDGSIRWAPASISEFVNRDGVLITTTASQPDEALRTVTDLVLYDLPTHTQAVRDLLGPFTALGRTKPLNIYVLVPHGSHAEDVDYPPESLREVLESATPGSTDSM